MPGVERDEQSVLKVSKSFGMHTPTPRTRKSPSKKWPNDISRSLAYGPGKSEK